MCVVGFAACADFRLCPRALGTLSLAASSAGPARDRLKAARSFFPHDSVAASAKMEILHQNWTTHVYQRPCLARYCAQRLRRGASTCATQGERNDTRQIAREVCPVAACSRHIKALMLMHQHPLPAIAPVGALRHLLKSHVPILHVRMHAHPKLDHYIKPQPAPAHPCLCRVHRTRRAPVNARICSMAIDLTRSFLSRGRPCPLSLDLHDGATCTAPAKRLHVMLPATLFSGNRKQNPVF